MAIYFKYGEILYGDENSDYFLLFCRKDPLGELFSEVHFKNTQHYTKEISFIGVGYALQSLDHPYGSTHKNQPWVLM